MSNSSRAHGRFFPIDYDLDRINFDVTQEQQESGTYVDWWFFDTVNSTSDDYGEGGRRWKGPTRIPVLDARRVPGALDGDTTAGSYVRDSMQIRLNYEQARLAGLTNPDIQTATKVHLNDRVVYMSRVWSIGNIDVTGQFEPENTEVVVVVTLSQLRPDELVDDVDFLAYAA